MHNDRFICTLVHVMYICIGYLPTEECMNCRANEQQNYMCHLTSDILEAGISWQRNVPICNESL